MVVVERPSWAGVVPGSTIDPKPFPPLGLVASGRGGPGTLSGPAPRLDLSEHRYEFRKGRTGIGGWSGLNPLASQLGTSGVNYFDVNGGPIPRS
jgi:hypothetical protein